MQSLGERIKEAREARGLSQGEVGRRWGVSEGYVTRLEGDPNRGKRMSSDKMRTLAAVLGVRIEWLEKGEGSRDVTAPVAERFVDYDLRYDGLVHEAVWRLGQRGKRVRPEAIGRARAAMKNDNPTVEQMIARIEQSEHDLRAEEKGKRVDAGRIDLDDGDAPPGLRVKRPRRGPGSA